MKRIGLFIALTGTVLLFSGFFISCFNSGYDIIIKNGKILDGTGNPWFLADLGIKNGKIVKIGFLNNSKAEKIIDAGGQYVSPGFIDVHTHADRKIAKLPCVKNYMLQGVTTVVGGNCGGHEFPVKDLFSKLEASGIGINFASLIGHNTIRREVMGKDFRDPTPEELETMKKLVKQEMESGCIGFSTGLAYIPGRFSKTEEIIELTKMIAPYNGIYATHMRNQGSKIKEAILESIRIGEEAGVPVEISHIKLASEDVWGKYDLICKPIEDARKRGIPVTMDQYPYTATSSGFTSSFPAWSVSGGHKKFVKRLQSPQKYQRIKKALIKKRLSTTHGVDKLKCIYVAYDKNHHEYEGKNIAQILEINGIKKTISNGADMIIKLEKEDQPRGIFFQMTEKDVSILMKKPYNMIISDGKIEVPGVEVPHPRAYGTFPRVIAKYVREKHVLTLPEAVRKMTSFPAQTFRFYDRGVIKQGNCADIVIFDFGKIKDTATFQKPHQYPKGISWVIVNGKVAAHDNKIINDKAGKIIYGYGKK